MGHQNDLNICGTFHIFTEKAESAQQIASVLNQFKIKADVFQGTSQVSFDIAPYELDHLSNKQVNQLSTAVIEAGGRFQGVGTYGLNHPSA